MGETAFDERFATMYQVCIWSSTKGRVIKRRVYQREALAVARARMLSAAPGILECSVLHKSLRIAVARKGEVVS